MIVAYSGAHKRALSYDERPRVVVEELKSSGANPVSCLVQHQNELRSPLALAVSRRNKAFKRLMEEETRSPEKRRFDSLPAQILPTPCGDKNAKDVRSATAKYAFVTFPYQAEGDGELDLEYGESALDHQSGELY